MERDQPRFLDLGGLNRKSPVFLDQALQNPLALYCIADLRADVIPVDNVPINLHIVKPELKGWLLSYKYHLPFPNDHFQSARMDMVLDSLLDPNLLIKVLAEIKRCLMMGGTFDIVDFDFNIRRAVKACKKAGLRSFTLFDNDELLTSQYPLSLTAEGFAEADYILSRLQAVK